VKRWNQLVVSSVAAVSALALAGCGGSSHATTPTTKPAASTPSSTPTPTPSAAPSVAAGAITIVDVPGYKYAALTAELQPILTTMKSTALISGADGREVLSGTGEDIAAVVVAQYNASMVPGLDAEPSAQILDGAAAGAKAAGGVNGKVSDGVVGGVHYRLIVGSQITFAVAYRKGGQIVEVLGPDQATVVPFMKAYLTAAAG
jgi:hypothetical protein